MSFPAGFGITAALITPTYSIPEDTVGNYLDPDLMEMHHDLVRLHGLAAVAGRRRCCSGPRKQKLTEGKELIKYFCQPCARQNPTAVAPAICRETLPDKWAAFKRYNVRDVEVEMSIQEKLAKFPVPEMVWEQYHLDQEINDRGVALDMELVHQAIAMDTRSRAISLLP